MTILDVQNAATFLDLSKDIILDLMPGARLPPDRAEEIAFEMERMIRGLDGIATPEHTASLRKTVAALRRIAAR